jgi:tetratricopeptide (TPR) repeat protein
MLPRCPKLDLPWTDLIRPLRVPALVVALLAPWMSAAMAEPDIGRAADKLRYENCLSLANLNPAAALGAATKWVGEKGGGPAQHCAAVALVGLKRYAEAADRLDALGRAPGMGGLRPSLFDQAGNAWMLDGEIDKAVASFEAGLALTASDPDLYGDLARAQAMQSDWGAVESDLNAALALTPRRADLLVLRASARHAQHHITEARADLQQALALEPKNAEALVERGAIERDAGDFAHARTDFQAALAARPAPETADAAKRNLAALDEAAKPSSLKKK